MKVCHRAFVALIIAATCCVRLVAQTPQTVAETSQFQATSRHADVLAFCQTLARESPVARFTDYGTSGEGRKLPLLFIADPPVDSLEQAARAGKLIILAQGNIHAGEVDGKEALLILARDLAQAKNRSLLKSVIVAIAPLVNPDGNEKLAKTNRPHQNGPAEVGVRTNADGFDLNRDFVKLETREVQALVRLYRRMNPAVVIDTHTTNGSFHRYTLTYDGPRHPACDEKLVVFVRDTMLPEVSKRVEQSDGFATFFYGNFDRERKKWEPYPAHLRYGTQYVALRGRIAILAESYVYASYRDRVRATRSFVHHCINVVAANSSKVKSVLDSAATTPDRIALRHELKASAKPVAINGFVEEMRDGKRVATDKKHDYTVTHFNETAATLVEPRPFAYVIPASWGKVIENLLRHGIDVEVLREDLDLPVRVTHIQAVNTAPKPYQGHKQIELSTTHSTETRRVSADSFVVRTKQPLGRLACLLLEPRSEDGLTTWNYFDEAIKPGAEHPVVSLATETSFLTTSARPFAEDRVMGKRLTAAMATSFPPAVNLSAAPIGGLRWLADGKHYLQGRGGRGVKVEAATGKSVPFFDSAKVAKAIRNIPSFDGKVSDQIVRQPPTQMNPAQTGFLFEHSNDLYYAAFDGSNAMRLTKSAGPKELVTFSPDGSHVAFVRNQNLFAVDLATQTERQLTTDGGGLISNGKADWVYFEEIFDRKYHAFWWSEDAKHIAFLRFDDTPVSKFTVVNHMTTRQNIEQTPYPKSGDPNPLVKLGIVAVAGGGPRFVDLKECNPSSTLLIRAAWKPDSSGVLFFVLDRAQTWMDVMSQATAGGDPVKLFRETTKAWVDDPGEPHFLKDGSFILASARTGWRHLYHFEKDGKLRRVVTEGPWEVRQVHQMDEKQGWLYFSGTKDSPIGSNLYRVRLSDSQVERLTTTPGDHRVQVSPTCNYFIDTVSSHSQPGKVRLHDSSGKVVRVLDSNPAFTIEEYQLGKFELVKIPTTDGFTIEGSLRLPVGFDPSKKYPVWFMTYAGPHMPTITDSWSHRLTDAVLANEGIIVFRCDPRSASGKGAVSAWSAYRQLGVQELKDIETAINWLIDKHPFVDKTRIGMSGHSYGGFMTAYAMTHSKLFCAGIAGAPVTDWKLYDSIYTERYMNTPKENPDGYARTSVVRSAKNLHGRLLILHGIMDDNVHVQNTVQFIDELQRADKDFEVMFYPRARHGIFGRHYQRLMMQFILKTMKPTDSADRSSQ